MKGGEWINQQDNAPCHTAGVVKQFFNDKNITVLSWPPRSPDMSPIETLRAIIKPKLRAITFSRKPQLINALLNICCRDNDVHALLNESCQEGLKLCTRPRARMQNFNFICMNVM